MDHYFPFFFYSTQFNVTEQTTDGVAEFALKELGAREKQLIWTEGAGHIITVDYGRERVFTEVEQWLRGHADRGAATAVDGRAAAERRES